MAQGRVFGVNYTRKFQ